MPYSAYIHIPFCKSKCKYCSFVSFPEINNISEYIKILVEEIKTKYNGEKLKTLYIGGGTPSLLKVSDLSKIIKNFNLDANYELTIELNPDDINYDYLKGLKDLGINRLSIGSQTFNDDILKLIGRRHDSKSIINAVNLAKNCDFNNINLDLIYGLPFQTIESLKKDLKQVINLDVQHISTYGLKIEQESFWGKIYNKNSNQLITHNNKIDIPDEDIQADMYELIFEILTKNKFYHYEISNFSKQNFESKHNLNYWNNQEYYGFGTAAHGYINGSRYSNIDNLKLYLEKENKVKYSQKLSLKEQLEEEIFLGFRKTSGININKINQKYNINFEKKYSKILQKYSNFITKTSQGYSLTLEGFMISNLILSEFLED